MATAALKNKNTVLNLASTVLPAAGSTVFSMIQPTGVFHVGNYLGAVRSWVNLQNSSSLPTQPSTEPRSSPTRFLFGVADLHALTLPKDPATLRFTRAQAVASMLATGLDPNKSIIFQQSRIPEHAQLYWLLSTVTGMGYLNRMTQWKSKAGLSESASLVGTNSAGEGNREVEEAFTKLKLGLFAYPCLQAADILLYKADYVPVGEDQSQHLELCRHIASAFNKQYPSLSIPSNDNGLGKSRGKKEVFPPPRTILAPYKKIASLRDPSKKMSKSDPDTFSCIYIPDSPKRIQKCIRRSVTDSLQGPITYDRENRAGVANLLEMAAGVLSTTETEVSPKQVLSQISPKDHKELKDGVAEILVEGLRPVREEYERLMADLEYVEKVAKEGSEKARMIAIETMKEVNEAVGLN